MKNDVYPSWKRAAWEAWRVFALAAAAVIVTQLQLGVDVNNFEAWLKTIAIASVTAGVKALFKYLREKYGNKEYDKLLYKIPF